MAARKETLCWDCKNAIPDLEGHGCRWSRFEKPVEGWTAELVEKACSDPTWNVKACPEFIQDDGKINLDLTPEDRLQDLADAIVISAARNYRNLCKAEARCRAVPGNMTRRKIYRGNHRHLYGFDYMGIGGALRRAEKFFKSGYARSLTDADPVWIMEEIQRTEGIT